MPPPASSNDHSKRSACDRCRGYKLRCDRGAGDSAQCLRCQRAKTVCVINANHPVGQTASIPQDPTAAGATRFIFVDPSEAARTAAPSASSSRASAATATATASTSSEGSLSASSSSPDELFDFLSIGPEFALDEQHANLHFPALPNVDDFTWASQPANGSADISHHGILERTGPLPGNKRLRIDEASDDEEPMERATALWKRLHQLDAKLAAMPPPGHTPCLLGTSINEMLACTRIFMSLVQHVQQLHRNRRDSTIDLHLPDKLQILSCMILVGRVHQAIFHQLFVAVQNATHPTDLPLLDCPEITMGSFSVGNAPVLQLQVLSQISVENCLKMSQSIGFQCVGGTTNTWHVLTPGGIFSDQDSAPLLSTIIANELARMQSNAAKLPTLAVTLWQLPIMLSRLSMASYAPFENFLQAVT